MNNLTRRGFIGSVSGFFLTTLFGFKSNEKIDPEELWKPIYNDAAKGMVDFDKEFKQQFLNSEIPKGWLDGIDKDEQDRFIYSKIREEWITAGRRCGKTHALIRSMEELLLSAKTGQNILLLGHNKKYMYDVYLNKFAAFIRQSSSFTGARLTNNPKIIEKFPENLVHRVFIGSYSDSENLFRGIHPTMIFCDEYQEICKQSTDRMYQINEVLMKFHKPQYIRGNSWSRDCDFS